MAQPILTSSTPILSVKVKYHGTFDHVFALSFVVDDTDQDGGTIYVIGEYPIVGTTEYANLEILQGMYARTQGITNAAGETISIGLSASEEESYIDSFDAIIAHGYLNPLIEGYKDKVSTGKKITGTWVSDGEFEQDATTGIKTVKVAANIEPANRTPHGATFDYPLSSWTVAQITEDNIRFRLVVPHSLEITPSQLDTYTPLIAFVGWLNSIRTMGSAIGTNYDHDGSFNNRQFTLAQETGDSGVVFEYDTTFSHNVDPDDQTSDVRAYDIFFDRVSGDAYSLSAVRNLLAETKIAVPTTTGIQESRIGSIGNVLEGRELVFNPGQRIYESMGHIMIDSVDEFGRPYSIPIAANVGRSIRYADLSLNLDGYRIVPVSGHLDTIHFGHAETSDGIVLLPTPTTLVTQENTHVIISFHNVSTDHNLTVEDWDGNDVMILYPGDYARFQITSDGNGGELIGQQVPFRTMNHSADFIGDFADMPRWQSPEPRTLILLPFNDSTTSQLHADAFTLGTVDPPAGDADDLVDETRPWADWQGSFTVNQPGLLIIDWSFQLHLVSDDGVFGSYHGMRLYRVRGTADPESLGELLNREFGGDDESLYNRFQITLQAEVGDVFFGVYRHSSRTISLSDVRFQVLRRFVRLFPHIQREWTP